MKIGVFYTWLRNNLHLMRLKRKKGITIGGNSVVYYKCVIDCRKNSYKNGGGCSIGNNCKIGHAPIGYHGGMPFHTSLLLDGKGSKISIGDNCRINGAYIHSEKSISIGNNCVIASGVNIIDTNGHQVCSLDRTTGRDVPKEIKIGNNVWICMNSTILKGTEIGDNSVIAAGSVIQGIIPPNTIASTQSNLTIKDIKYERH